MQKDNLEDLDLTYLKLVNENSDIYQIASYIMEQYPQIFTLEEAKRVANFLLKDGLTKVEIVTGNKNSEIERHVDIKKARESIKDYDETPVYVPLITKVKHIDSKIVKTCIRTFIGISALFILTKSVENFMGSNVERQATYDIGVLAGNEFGLNIVEQNTKDMDNSVIIYKSDQIAEDIINICKKDEKLMDVCLYNTYFKMEFNKLNNMDRVFYFVKLLANGEENKEAFKLFNFQAQNCETFLDYLVKKSYLDINNPDYESIIEAVNKYREFSKEDGITMNYLSEDEQLKIQTIINNYAKDGDRLYNESIKTLDNEVDSNGLRGR